MAWFLVKAQLIETDLSDLLINPNIVKHSPVIANHIKHKFINEAKKLGLSFQLRMLSGF